LLGSSAYTYGDFVAVAESMARDDTDLEPLIEARTDLAGTPEAFAEYAAGRASAMKTLVFPHGTTSLKEA
jgi:threonine dehydrogenase-like Zn-dependent dehydrogenase